MSQVSEEIIQGLGEGYTAFLAPEGQIEPLLAVNNAPIVGVFERLVIVRGQGVANPFSQNTWSAPRYAEVESIGAAAKILRGIQRSWAPYSWSEFRRVALIAEKLPPIKGKPLDFLQEIPTSPLGSFSLLARNGMIYAGSCSSNIPNGAAIFNEDKEGPPSRAYLKLWELFTVFGLRPQAGQSCFEIGAAPGGWSHVLAAMGCRLQTIDRAALADHLEANRLIKHELGDAFKKKPADVGPIDWFFSDIICYPDKLFAYVKEWLDSGLCGNFVCTLKFQKAEHYAAINEFLQIPGSRALHLFHNKHELTWFLKTESANA